MEGRGLESTTKRGSAELSGGQVPLAGGQIPLTPQGPLLPTVSFLVHFGVNLAASYPVYCAVCEISWCRCQQLIALSISTASVTNTISHRAVATPGTEVRCECPMTSFPALPLLATNPGDATAGSDAVIVDNVQFCMVVQY